MANLKGSTHEKQVNNAIRRLEARGEKRFGTDSHLTHSNSTAEKREMYLNDFAQYAQNKGFEDKLNTLMTKENIQEFISERTLELGDKSSLDYAAGFNSMLQGLQETKVGIPDGAKEVLQEATSSFREDFNKNNDFQKDRAITDTKGFIGELRDIREESAVIAELQLETGLRVSEALEVIGNFESHYIPDNSSLMGIIGKGGQEYNHKELSSDLYYHFNTILE